MNNINNTYTHKHYAHCESGVMSAMLSHAGLEISEPMVFGLTASLTFAHIPFMKMSGLPVTSYRMFPGNMIKKLPKIVGVKYYKKKYRDQNTAMAELDELLNQGQLVGLQCSVYFLPYFPPEMRFQFNAHNILVIEKNNDTYTVSDPVFDHLVTIKDADLRKARFARGLAAPKGFMHYPLEKPRSLDYNTAIKKSLKKIVNMMLYAPVPFIGVKGMNFLANRIEKLPKKYDTKYSRHYIGNIVRMQEEIGTGGGGFRFLYAAFLQEAAEITGNATLQQASTMMTEAGDLWRTFAVGCAEIIKRKEAVISTEKAADKLRQCAAKEKEIYQLLHKISL